MCGGGVSLQNSGIGRGCRASSDKIWGFLRNMILYCLLGRELRYLLERFVGGISRFLLKAFLYVSGFHLSSLEWKGRPFSFLLLHTDMLLHGIREMGQLHGMAVLKQYLPSFFQYSFCPVYSSSGWKNSTLSNEFWQTNRWLHRVRVNKPLLKSSFGWACLLLWGGLVVACSGDEPPVPPQPRVEEASEIERNSAKLSGAVSYGENATVETCCFRYGLSSEMELSVTAMQSESGKLEARIEGLQAGKTYYYCLEIASSKSSLRSSVRTFQTLPNLVPAIGALTLVNKGPLNATVRCEMTDAGGEDFTRIGFLYKKDGASTETFVAATVVSDDYFMAQLGGLDMGTDYSVKACAANSLGEMQSESLTFQTNSAIQVAEAGTLAEIVGTEWKYRLKSITIAGDLNGTDICFLREMLGKEVSGKDTEGILETVNLTDCHIVKGGKAYYASRYTSDNTLGSEMFGGCVRLKQITLPQSVLTVEEDAFRGCTSLESLTIPEKLTTMEYSSGCTKLTAYSVSPMNGTFSVVDGVLYSSDRTQLILYPMGRADELFAFPEEVTQIGKNAFRESMLQSVTIPDRIKTIGEFAFAHSALNTAKVGNGVTRLSTGLFQQCSLLASVTLGEDTRRVESYAFSGCSALSSIELPAITPGTCEKSAFDADTYGRCTLSVPQGCKSAYRNSTWSGFNRIVETGN